MNCETRVIYKSLCTMSAHCHGWYVELFVFGVTWNCIPHFQAVCIWSHALLLLNVFIQQLVWMGACAAWTILRIAEPSLVRGLQASESLGVQGRWCASWSTFNPNIIDGMRQLVIDIEACVKLLLYLCIHGNSFINGAIQQLVDSKVHLRIVALVSWLNPLRKKLEQRPGLRCQLGRRVFGAAST